MSIIGILGGTFDPVHVGHLRLATEAAEQIPLDHVRLIPCHTPAHREAASASQNQRLRMVALATACNPRLVCDDLEIQRGGISYMIDTMKILRDRYPNNPLCLILGYDAFGRINHWKCWEKLAGLCHFAVAARPGEQPPWDPSLTAWCQNHRAGGPSELSRSRGGRILFLDTVELPVSASDIRQRCSAGRSIRYLVTDAVFRYIEQQRLYIDDRNKHGI